MFQPVSDFVRFVYPLLFSAVLVSSNEPSDNSSNIFPTSTAAWNGPYIGRYDILRLVTSQNPILLRYTQLPRMSQQQWQFYRDHVQINATTSRLIFYQTLFQDNTQWKMERQIRITASTAYHLYTYGEESTSKNRTEYDWQNKIGSMAIRDRPQTIYMQYGSDHEDVALALLEKKIKSQGGCYLRKKCGILVNSNLPWIGYSPDAIVKTPNQTFLIEVKCPFVGQVKEGIDFLKSVSFFSVNSTTGEVQMRKKHANYAQVQVGMLITNLPLAKMVIYCKKANGIFELDIPFDPEYTENLLARLKDVYFKQYLPFLTDHQDKLWKTSNFTLESTVRQHDGNASTTNHWYKEWYQQLNNLRPQLSCILFGNPACQISCEVFCDMYGCWSNGTCSNKVYCDCQEEYNVSATVVNTSQYRTLSLDDLWNHRFRPSNASSEIKAALQSDAQLSKKLLADLRNPHTTARDIVTKLPYTLQTKPNLNFSLLEPTSLGILNHFVMANNTFDHDKFRRYVEEKLDELSDDLFTQFKKIKRKEGFEQMIKYVKDEEDVKYVMRQLFLFPSDFIKVFAQENSYNISQVLNYIQPSSTDSYTCYKSPCLGETAAFGFINNTAYRDEILLAGTIETFIEVISTYND